MYGPYKSNSQLIVAPLLQAFPATAAGGSRTTCVAATTSTSSSRRPPRLRRLAAASARASRRTAAAASVNPPPRPAASMSASWPPTATAPAQTAARIQTPSGTSVFPERVSKFDNLLFQILIKSIVVKDHRIFDLDQRSRSLPKI